MSRDRINRAFMMCVSLLFCLGSIGLASIAAASPMAQETPAAEVAPTATRTPQAGEQTYAVESGDSLWLIAVKFYGDGTKYTLLQRANNLSDNAKLRIGAILIIPPLPEGQRPPSPKPVMPTPTPTAPLLSRFEAIMVAPANGSAPDPTVAPTPLVLSAPAPRASQPSITPLLPYVALALNTLSGICFLGSVFCAYLSFDTFRRSRHFVKRRSIGLRVHVGL